MPKPVWLTVMVMLSLLAVQCGQPERATIDLEELTVSRIHQAYADGQYTCAQLVQAYIDRIRRYDAKINAITIVNPRAVEIARALDRELEDTGKLRALHGVPMIVKDNFNTRGLPTTGGALALKDFIPAADAFMVARLKKAGAVIIAKSNMAEWAFSPMHTESSTAGTTRNPYNPEYVPAGSSGGTAAAIAANFGVIGLGTDTGNSIRGPSSHNALAGFRPTLGLVSRHGIIPLYLRNDVGGPMCRTVEDAARVLEVIAAYDPNDPITRRCAGRIPEGYTRFLDRNGLKGARIGVLRELSEDNPDPEISALFEKAIADIRSAGGEIVDPVTIPGFNDLRKHQWCDVFRKDIEAFLAEFVKREDMRTLEDIIRAGSDSAYAKESLEYFATHSGRPEHPEIPCRDAYADVRRVAFREAIEKSMNDARLDAIIYPTWNNRPARIDAYREEYRGDNNQIIAPHTGQPAFTVPMGVTKGNLPAGLQFLGRMFAEPTLIRLAYAYEQATRHRTLPPRFPFSRK